MTLTPAEQLAVLQAMTADLPDRPDLRSTAEIEYESLLEQRAEWRKDVRENPTDAESEWLARRRSA